MLIVPDLENKEVFIPKIQRLRQDNMGYTELWLISDKCLWQNGQADSSRPGLRCLRVFGDLKTCQVGHLMSLFWKIDLESAQWSSNAQVDHVECSWLT